MYIYIYKTHRVLTSVQPREKISDLKCIVATLTFTITITVTMTMTMTMTLTSTTNCNYYYYYDYDSYLSPPLLLLSFSCHTLGLHHKISVFSDPDPGKS